MPFEQWVEWLFSDEQTWSQSWAAGFREPPPPPQTLEYLIRLFDACDSLLQDYSDQQANDGLYRILSSGESTHFFALYDAICPWELRRDAIRSMENVFAKLFAARCTPALGHLSEEGSPLNLVCYMWWDVSLLYGASPGDPSPQLTNPELLDVMRKTLAVDHDAVQESALHGLGHWQMYWPKEVTAIVDEFLASPAAKDLRPELRQYALNARGGCVL